MATKDILIMKKYILIVITIICFNCFSEETKHNLSICSVFRNEAPYLKEWIEYHRLVGVDHFYLYDNESDDWFWDVLKPYVDRGIVTLRECHETYSTLPPNKDYRWVHTVQEPAFKEAIQKSIGETKWLAILDLDEFILPIRGDKITDILEYYENAVGVTIDWHCYGSSYLETLPSDKLMIEALYRKFPDGHNLNKGHMKSIIKPEKFTGFTWIPHYCTYTGGLTSLTIPQNIARINHYIMRSKANLISKLENRERSVNHKYSQEEIDRLLDQANDVADENREILKYANELRLIMELD
jgi:hypothetical protein